MISMPAKIQVRDLSVSYGEKVALKDINLDINRNEILAIIGPANSGKTTLLKCINRTIEFISAADVTGHVTIDGESVTDMRNFYRLRQRIGMVFPLPVGLPMTVYDNVAYAPRLGGKRNKADLNVLVEKCLRQAALWDWALATSPNADRRADQRMPHRGWFQRSIHCWTFLCQLYQTTPTSFS